MIRSAPVRRILLLLLLFLSLIVAGGLAWRYYPRRSAVTVPRVPPRDQCLDMVVDDPEGALQAARGLRGAAALHCEGLAEIELGSADVGAPLLMRAGRDASLAPGARAAILGEASRAYLMIDNASAARGASRAALALVPNDPDLRFDDAIAALAVKDFAGAIADLAVSLAADPRNEQALVARATAYRQIGKLPQARADADVAVAIDPDDQDALLERGIIRQREGDAAGARSDWQRVESIDPASSSAELAAQNLALLAASGG